VRGEGVWPAIEVARLGPSSEKKKGGLPKVFFANFCHHGATWYATSASDACVARLEPRMDHLIRFRDPDG